MKASAASKPEKKPKGKASLSSDPLYLQHLFSANVRLVRVAQGISQEELAHRASLDRTYISSIERRLRNLSIQNIQRPAVALSVDPGELLDSGLQDDPRFRT